MLKQLVKKMASRLSALKSMPWSGRRYRVASWRNPFAFRRGLLRDIRRELRDAGFLSGRQPPSTSR